MIREMFNTDRPVFITFEDDRFNLGLRRRDEVAGTIADIYPVRKRFVGNRIACRSMDAVTGCGGRRCALCRDRWTCTERIRLMLLLDGLADGLFPAILEIGHASFDALDAFVEDVGIDRLANQKLVITMERIDGRLRFDFRRAD